MGLLGVLGVVFVVLKLLNIITWSWLAVLSPFLIWIVVLPIYVLLSVFLGKK